MPVLALRHSCVRQASVQADLVRGHHVHAVARGMVMIMVRLVMMITTTMMVVMMVTTTMITVITKSPVNRLIHLSCLAWFGVVCFPLHAWAREGDQSSKSSHRLFHHKQLHDHHQPSHLGPPSRRPAVAQSCQGFLEILTKMKEMKVSRCEIDSVIL